MFGTLRFVYSAEERVDHTELAFRPDTATGDSVSGAHGAVGRGRGFERTYDGRSDRDDRSAPSLRLKIGSVCGPSGRGVRRRSCCYHVHPLGSGPPRVKGCNRPSDTEQVFDHVGFGLATTEAPRFLVWAGVARVEGERTRG